ncbi:hypothetical protein DKX38_027224 [Salix brachista]|uniref:Uncharacterized protein n=1 Tax=Salix brachista TaxID=2182728 RepID=A0A5N5JD78_9ROSI|nr:hypothetical protein DKX38_027224 [Salix brachista]
MMTNSFSNCCVLLFVTRCAGAVGLISFVVVVKYVKSSLVNRYGVGAYFNILPGSEWTAIMLTYGFPLAIIELKPVPCLTSSDAEMLREKCATPILKTGTYLRKSDSMIGHLIQTWSSHTRVIFAFFSKSFLVN